MHLGVEKDWSSISESSSEELSVTSEICASSDSIVFSEDLVSLQNLPSPCQMADAHEEQLNVLTLLTNVICNGKKGWPDIIYI